MPNYLNIIGEFFPNTIAYVSGAGNPSIYSDIQWKTTPIAQATLDTYVGQEGATLETSLIINYQPLVNRQVPMYDAPSGKWKNHISGKLYRINMASQTFSSTLVPIFMDTNIRTDSELYTYSSMPLGETTVLEDGWYSISYDITCSSNSLTQQISEHGLYVNGVLVPGSISNGCHLTLSNGSNTASANILIQLLTNDKIQIKSKSISGGNVTTVIGGCRLKIEAIG